LKMNKTTEPPILVINTVAKKDEIFSWGRRLDFTYNGHKFCGVLLTYEAYEPYILLDLDNEGAAFLGDLVHDHDFLQALDELSCEKQCANLPLELR
jgi:hypothetical protein